MEIKPNELRIGNFVFTTGDLVRKVECIQNYGIIGNINHYQLSWDEIKPIPLTSEILVNMGFEKVPAFTVTNSIFINLSRNRQLSVSCVGTPNEMVFLADMDENTPTDLICIRNYDYDGATYVHSIQNIIHSITGQELEFTL